MTEKEMMTWFWALIGIVAAIASTQLLWPISLVFFGLGVWALVMAVRAEWS